jgi:hypothetical protein
MVPVPGGSPIEFHGGRAAAESNSGAGSTPEGHAAVEAAGKYWIITGYCGTLSAFEAAMPLGLAVPPLT